VEFRSRPNAREVQYSFRAALEGDAFHQLPALDVRAFGKAAKQRGANLSFGSTLRSRLEELDRSGALSPIYFDVGSEPVLREEHDFVPWSEYEVADDYASQPRPFYAHWQLLYLQEAVDLGRVEVTLSWLLDDERRVSLSEQAAGIYSWQRERWQSTDWNWRSTVLLLVRLQNRYAPLIKGTLTTSRSTLIYDPDVGDYVDPYHEEVRRFDPQTVLAELGLAEAGIKDVQRELAIYGASADPMAAWHMLLRMTSYKEREKLKGAVRRAHDAYDAAEILRRFYYDLTGELLLNPDEIFDVSDKSWKQRLFGRWPFLTYTRADLQAELRRHDLWPHQVHLIVEGETEAIVCRRVIESVAATKLSDLGIHLATLRGVGRVRLHQELIRATHTFSRHAVLVADREGDIEREVELMKNDGLLTDESVLLWDASFEEDNFGDEELTTMLEGLAQEVGVDLSLDPQAFRARYDEHRERVGKDARGAMTYMLGMAAEATNRRFKPSKTLVGERLAQLLLTNLLEHGEEAEAERPILRLLASVIRVT
jgi:hypothetical protein